MALRATSASSTRLRTPMFALVALLSLCHSSQALRSGRTPDEGITLSEWVALTDNGSDTSSVDSSNDVDRLDAQSQAFADTGRWTFLFCRHAESLQNVFKHGMKAGKLWNALFSGSLSFDSPLSDRGRVQAEEAHEFLASRMSDLHRRRLMTSTLQRAIVTGKMIFQPDTADPWPMQDGGLDEKRLKEYTSLKGQAHFESRIKDFIMRMLQLPQEQRPEVVVGHSKWFRTLRQLWGVLEGDASVNLIQNTECRVIHIEETTPGENFSVATHQIYVPPNATSSTPVETSSMPSETSSMPDGHDD